MSINKLPVLGAGEPFLAIPPSVKYVILLPTARCTPIAQAIIASMVGIANAELAVLIADNSENVEKQSFLQKIQDINPNIIAIAHKKNIGATENFLYLFDWCKHIPFCAVMADDDWMSPTYHLDAFKALSDNPKAACAEVGAALIDFGDGRLQGISQAAINGQTAIERVQQWNATQPRITMYNASKRDTLEKAIDFYRTTPLDGITLLENLWELSRLSVGDFISVSGHGCFVHYPAHSSGSAGLFERYYQLLCKDVGLQFPFVYFMPLSTAIQCALFLKGNLSPINDREQRKLCSQHVFRHIFLDSFLSLWQQSGVHQLAITTWFINHPKALKGYLKFCQSPFINNPVFDEDGYEIIDWFIEIIKVFEPKPAANELALSEKFNQFVDEVMDKAW